MENKEYELAESLRALGEPMRLKIYLQILQRRHCTRSLSFKLGITESAVSQHLRILRDAGLVRREKYGYHTHYIPSGEVLSNLSAALEQMCAQAARLESEPKACQCEYREQVENMAVSPDDLRLEKAENITRIAVPFEDGKIFGHFGHAPSFKIYDVADKSILTAQVISRNGWGHGQLLTALRECDVDVLLCGGIGRGARILLDKAGILLLDGCTGNADTVVAAYLRGTLTRDERFSCSLEASGGMCEKHCGDIGNQ